MRYLSILLLLAFLVVIPLTKAHFNLKEPMPYNRAQCKRPHCKGPCPAVGTSGRQKARNSPNNPSRIWKRGQEVTVEWQRNNHEGGFYRRSLVPVQHMNDAGWHKKLAFEWGCYNQNRFYCGKSPDCGTDKMGIAYRNIMTVPKVFPNGDYVFSMVWYGGIASNRTEGFFSDYYTCAYVRIQGGDFVNEHTPTFVRGENIRNVAPGKCASGSSFIGKCAIGPCPNQIRDMLPGEFQNGRSPPKVYKSFLGEEAQARSTIQLSPLQTERAGIAEEEEAAAANQALISRLSMNS